MRVLITGVGGAAAISVWKSLKDQHTLFMADIDPCAAGLYLVPATHRFLIPRGDSPQFVKTVFELCVKHDIEVVIATVDSELFPLSEAIDQFKYAGIKVPLCSPEVLKLCYDKALLLKACEGSTPLPNYTILTADNRHAFKQFPYFAKPRVGAGSTGAMTIHHENDLSPLPTDGTYLIQELLPGDEFSVDTYIDSQGRPIAAVTRLRMKVDSGVAVTARTVEFPALSQQAINVALAVGIRYVANIQFKQATNGEYKLLEINPRFSGAMPLTVAAGVDMPKLLMDDVAGKSLPPGLMSFKELMVVRYWSEHFFPTSEWETLCHQQISG